MHRKIIEIKEIKPIGIKTRWANYQAEINFSDDPRFSRIAQIISSLKDASSLVEIASNQGFFANYLLENTHLLKIIATDYDVMAVDCMYKRNKKNKKLLPLVLDIVRINTIGGRQPIERRVSADIVIALAVTHHLILSQQIEMSYIFDNMAKLTKKYILIEFMPLGLSGITIKNPNLPSFYTKECFEENFKVNFELLSCETLEANRILYLGKLKSI